MTKISTQTDEKQAGEDVAFVTPTEVHELNKISKKWYILSVVATLLFCPLFGLMGLAHALFAAHNGELGNVQSQRRWIKKTKVYTGLAFAFGSAAYIAVIFIMIDANCWYCFHSPRYYSGNSYTNDYDYRWPESSTNIPIANFTDPLLFNDSQINDYDYRWPGSATKIPIANFSDPLPIADEDPL